MKEKIYDFGRFGKWSAETLLAQSRIAVIQAPHNVIYRNWRSDFPKAIQKELNTISKEIEELENKRIRGKLGKVWELLEQRRILEEEQNKFDEIEDIIIGLFKKENPGYKDYRVV